MANIALHSIWAWGLTIPHLTTPMPPGPQSSIPPGQASPACICHRADGRWMAALRYEDGHRHFVYGKARAEVVKS